MLIFGTPIKDKNSLEIKTHHAILRKKYLLLV